MTTSRRPCKFSVKYVIRKIHDIKLLHDARRRTQPPGGRRPELIRIFTFRASRPRGISSSSRTSSPGKPINPEPAVFSPLARPIRRLSSPTLNFTDVLAAADIEHPVYPNLTTPTYASLPRQHTTAALPFLCNSILSPAPALGACRRQTERLSDLHPIWPRPHPS